jgi:HEAT repeat-containing protein 5
MYEKLGRMMGRSYEETLQILVKTIKNTESQMRIEIICTLEKVHIQFWIKGFVPNCT